MECPASKGFETSRALQTGSAGGQSTMECPASKGFETAGAEEDAVPVVGYDGMPRFEGV